MYCGWAWHHFGTGTINDGWEGHRTAEKNDEEERRKKEGQEMCLRSTCVQWFIWGFLKTFQTCLPSKSLVNLLFPVTTALPSNSCPWVQANDSPVSCTPAFSHLSESATDGGTVPANTALKLKCIQLQRQTGPSCSNSVVSQACATAHKHRFLESLHSAQQASSWQYFESCLGPEF